MKKIFITDLNECRRLWESFIPARHITDDWNFRLCFHHHYQCPPRFMVLQDHEGIAALIPLSFQKQMNQHVFFPGEIWNGRTWIERTPIYFRNPERIQNVLEKCPDNTYLRYLEKEFVQDAEQVTGDEIGYVLYPGRVSGGIQDYYRRFSNKRLKNLFKCIHNLCSPGFRFYLNRLDDFERLVEMNIDNFGSRSYLYDERFRNGFKGVVSLLHKHGLLRLISLEIDGRLTAVDLGVLYRGTYTILMGGTRRDMPGVAKVINMYHIEYAFASGISKVDFLCGDFHWKKLWHLDPEPLYAFKTQPECTRIIPGTMRPRMISKDTPEPAQDNFEENRRRAIGGKF